MDGDAERRRYYATEEDVPLSQAVRDAIEASDHASLGEDEIKLYDHINPDAIDMLFQDTADVDISVQLRLTNVTVSIWSDGGIEIRVSDKIE